MFAVDLNFTNNLDLMLMLDSAILQPLLVVIQLQEDLLGFCLHFEMGGVLDVQYPSRQIRHGEWTQRLKDGHVHDDTMIEKDSVLC